MANQNLYVTQTPTEVPNVEVGTNYVAQNVSGSILRFGGFATQPGSDARGFRVLPDEKFLIQPVSGETVYVWAEFYEYGEIVYDVLVSED